MDENRLEGTARNLGGKAQEAWGNAPAMRERKPRAQSIRRQAPLRTCRPGDRQLARDSF